MGPLGLSDSQLQILMACAATVPPDLRNDFLLRISLELHGQTLGDGLVHRVAHSVARELAWDAEDAAQAHSRAWAKAR
jgi:hypothetical protein